MAKKKEQSDKPVQDPASEALELAKANQKAIEELKDQFEKAFKALDSQYKLLVERNRLR
jgi:hypothetical protein